MNRKSKNIWFFLFSKSHFPSKQDKLYYRPTRRRGRNTHLCHLGVIRVYHIECVKVFNSIIRKQLQVKGNMVGGCHDKQFTCFLDNLYATTHIKTLKLHNFSSYSCHLIFLIMETLDFVYGTRPSLQLVRICLSSIHVSSSTFL